MEERKTQDGRGDHISSVASGCVVFVTRGVHAGGPSLITRSAVDCTSRVALY